MSTTSQLQKRFFSLPENLQDAVRSESNNALLLETAKKYMLDENQQSDLISEAAYVLLGESPRDKFAEKIKGIPGIGEQPARAMAKIIDEHIFAPLAEEIFNAEKLKLRESSDAGEPAQVPPPERAAESPQIPPAIDESPEEIVMLRKEAPKQAPATEVSTEKDAPPEETPSEIIIESVASPEDSSEESPKNNAEENVIAIPNITVTKPPRFIPLKDLKQGSIKTRPAPEGIPAATAMPSFPKPSSNAIHTLKNDVKSPSSQQSKPQMAPPQVLSRIEPTPERIASTLSPVERAQPTATPSPSSPAPIPPKEPSIGDPYREPVDMS